MLIEILLEDMRFLNPTQPRSGLCVSIGGKERELHIYTHFNSRVEQFSCLVFICEKQKDEKDPP